MDERPFEFEGVLEELDLRLPDMIPGADDDTVGLLRDVLTAARTAMAHSDAKCVEDNPPSDLKLRGTRKHGLRWECSHASKHCYAHDTGKPLEC